MTKIIWTLDFGIYLGQLGIRLIRNFTFCVVILTFDFYIVIYGYQKIY